MVLVLVSCLNCASLSNYVAGVSERIRRVCRDFNIRAVFKSGPTLRSLLTKVKDPLPREKQANIVYEVPCTCHWRDYTPAWNTAEGA